MDAGNQRERHRAPEPNAAQDRDPERGMHFVEQHDEDGANLHPGIHLAPDARTKIADRSNRIQQPSDQHDEDVAREDQDGDAPPYFVHDGKHNEQGAEQELVGNGVEILAELGVLMQLARQQPVEAIGQAGDDQDEQRPTVVTLEHGNRGERNKDEPQQRELVGRGPELADHGASQLRICASVRPKARCRSRPVEPSKRSRIEGNPPEGWSSSTRSTRCSGNITMLAAAGSAALSERTKSSNERRSMPATASVECVMESSTPQNFSRGAPSVTITTAPAEN